MLEAWVQCKGHVPCPVGPITQRGPVTVNLKLGVSQNHIRSHQVGCANNLKDGELPSITKVTGRSEIWTPDPFGDTLNPLEHLRPYTPTIPGSVPSSGAVETCRIWSRRLSLQCNKKSRSLKKCSITQRRTNIWYIHPLSPWLWRQGTPLTTEKRFKGNI